jgi:hypothetical protein
MRPVAIAALLSLALALWCEAFYKLGATWDIANLLGSVAVYAPYLLAADALMAALPKVPDAAWMALWGAAGLAFEWVAVGNSPWGNPVALQWGMFVFHAAYPVWGRAALPARFTALQRRFLWRAWAVFTVLGLAGALLPAPAATAWFILVPLGFYALLCLSALTGRPRGG